MAKVTMIQHVNVQISDRQRTRQWYETVLGAEFLDRGPAINPRQLQLRIGSGEMHFTETLEATRVPAVHFALEVDDWEGTLSHLRAVGVPYSRGRRTGTGPEADPGYGQREDTDQYYTYIHDPDGNMIELVHHPLGLETGAGQAVEIPNDVQGLRWRQLSGFMSQATTEV